MSYPIIQKFIHKNRPYTPLNPKGGVIHETDNPNDSDEMEQQYFDSNSISASSHAFIDYDSITQFIPWDEVAWHAGRTANRQFWGVELCHTSDPIKFNEIWKRGVWLYAYLFTKVAIPPIETVTKQNLMSHAEVSEEWQETNHMDPVEYFALFGKTVGDFRADVQKEINRIMGKVAESMSLEEAIKILVEQGITNSPDFRKKVCDVVEFESEFVINVAKKILELTEK